jgi:catechol 2,3-dioxygenase-like lactoylglutathione lyase family enzyme
LQILLIEHLSPTELLPPAPALGSADSTVSGIDHVVIFSQDLPASLRLWTDALGIAERWRKELPQRGTQNVGLRLGDVTVELVMRTDSSPTTHADALWGIAYRLPSCDAGVVRLRETGLDASDAREGLAPRTRVATLRWSRTPTLLLSYLPRT